MVRAIEQLRQAMEACELGALSLPDQIDALMDAGKEVLQEISTLTPPNEWVSVEERLPTDERPVLVFVGYADTMTGFITTSSYFCFDENPHWQWDGLVRDEQRTLFWMPLPSPPERRPPEEEEDT